MTSAHAPELQAALLEAAQTQDSDVGEKDEYGRRYTIDLAVTGPKGTARDRSGWIIRTDENFPRLTTCYVDEGGNS